MSGPEPAEANVLRATQQARTSLPDMLFFWRNVGIRMRERIAIVHRVAIFTLPLIFGLSRIQNVAKTAGTVERNVHCLAVSSVMTAVQERPPTDGRLCWLAVGPGNGPGDLMRWGMADLAARAGKIGRGDTGDVPILHHGDDDHALSAIDRVAGTNEERVQLIAVLHRDCTGDAAAVVAVKEPAFRVLGQHLIEKEAEPGGSFRACVLDCASRGRDGHIGRSRAHRDGGYQRGGRWKGGSGATRQERREKRYHV